MSEVWLEFVPNDVLFFRGPEPYNAGETGFVRSEFPPSPHVMQGALRTGLLYANGADAGRYRSGTVPEHLRAAVGSPGEYDLGIELEGPYLSIHRELYVPLPLSLAVTENGIEPRTPSDGAVLTDLGRLRLPGGPGEKQTDGHWISWRTLRRHLAGDPISRGDLIQPRASPNGEKPPLAGEPKVGLGLDRSKRTAREGLLYSIEPLRFERDASLVLRVSGLPEGVSLPTEVALGGEGRFARVSTLPAPNVQPDRDRVAQTVEKTHRFRLVLLQPALFARGWIPDGLKLVRGREHDCWEGELNGVRCRLVSACLEKPRRIGGWDMANNRPKPLRSYVPAGSVYFFETDAPGAEVVEKLDDARVGADGRLGFGQCVVGGGWS